MTTAFQADAFQADALAFQIDIDPGIVPPPLPSSSGGTMRGRGSGRFVRVDDGTTVRLSAFDTETIALTDRVAVFVGHVLAVRDAVAWVAVDAATVDALSKPIPHDAVVLIDVDRVVVGKDDTQEVMRLLKMTAPKQRDNAPEDVKGIWALIDAMRGRKKPN